VARCDSLQSPRWDWRAALTRLRTTPHHGTSAAQDASLTDVAAAQDCGWRHVGAVWGVSRVSLYVNGDGRLMRQRSMMEYDQAWRRRRESRLQRWRLASWTGTPVDTPKPRIEITSGDGVDFRSIMRAVDEPVETTLVTQPDFNQQVGFIKHEAGGRVPRHAHIPLEHHLAGTSQVALVRCGSCRLDVYTEDRELDATREAQQ